jgi:hypothetical protein
MKICSAKSKSTQKINLFLKLYLSVFLALTFVISSSITFLSFHFKLIIRCIVITIMLAAIGYQALDLKGNEYLIETLNKSPKIFPKEFYDQIILSCNEENTVINRTSNSKNITTTMIIKNNSKHDIFLIPTVRQFQVRPRLWDKTGTKVLKDGIPLSLAGPKNKHFIPAGETFKERFSFDVAKIENFPKLAKYLIFEVVHEGVRWLPRSNKCSFEIVHE